MNPVPGQLGTARRFDPERICADFPMLAEAVERFRRGQAL